MSLMVLGTASHVGKSTIVAAICRTLVRRGIGIAPFKSQNMSLNSYVTADGGEIGIAQAMQAFAAGLEPTVEMNPILLKPKGDKVSQVILLGRPYRDLPIREYYREVDFLFSKVLEAANHLLKCHGQLVIEGAGGAAELNLYDRDIANIRIARVLQPDIILVADIERGGVFAQIYGTLTLLPPEIRSLVKGIIINKFRGDPDIFAEGRRQIEDLCRIPVIGVIPFIQIDIASEDSLSIPDKKGRDHQIRIAVVRMPRISNFTDFEPLEKYVRIDYVFPGGSLSGYDCVILPGTKNTVDDLRELERLGFRELLHEARERGIPIIGICGGYQMLGREIVDNGIESAAGVYQGFGLLDVTTHFGPYRKTTVQVRRQPKPVPPILARSGQVSGYEIHMGDTERGNAGEAFEGEGSVSPDGLVIGTYMHGLFHNRQFLEALLGYLFEQRGIRFEGTLQESDPYDDVADQFEAHVDMHLILNAFGSRDVTV